MKLTLENIKRSLGLHCFIRHRFSLDDLDPVGSDPVQEVRHLSVDTRICSQGAALTPGNDTDLSGFSSVTIERENEKRTARVTLARVNSTVGRVTSADHGREDFWGVCGSTIGGVAISVGDYGDFNAAELVGDDTTGASGSPSRYGENKTGSRVELFGWWRQENGLCRRDAQVQWSIQKEQRDVVLKG